MLRFSLLLLVLLFLVVGIAMAWQHGRFVETRRSVLHDHQEMFHSSDVFHAMLFLRSPPNVDILDELKTLKHATESSEAKWIYAGKALAAPLFSSQLGPKDWSAIVLLQYPSREAFDRHAASEALLTARARFDETYVHGLQRSSFLSAMFPQMLLAIRVGQIVGGRHSYFPFQPAEHSRNLPQAVGVARRLREETELGRDGILIFNLIQLGSEEEQAANSEYGRAMFGAMAEGAYGPMHVGRAVTVEGDARFDHVAIVYYPGVEFFADMALSDYFQSIIGDKQLGDSQAVITVPVLDRL